MTPQQALALLTQATGLLNLTREEHQSVTTAIMVLNGLVEEDTKKPKEKPVEKPKEVEAKKK